MKTHIKLPRGLPASVHGQLQGRQLPARSNTGHPFGQVPGSREVGETLGFRHPGDSYTDVLLWSHGWGEEGVTLKIKNTFNSAYITEQGSQIRIRNTAQHQSVIKFQIKLKILKNSDFSKNRDYSDVTLVCKDSKLQEAHLLTL